MIEFNENSYTFSLTIQYNRSKGKARNYYKLSRRLAQVWRPNELLTVLEMRERL